MILLFWFEQWFAFIFIGGINNVQYDEQFVVLYTLTMSQLQQVIYLFSTFLFSVVNSL